MCCQKFWGTRRAKTGKGGLSTPSIPHTPNSTDKTIGASMDTNQWPFVQDKLGAVKHTRSPNRC